MKFNETLSEAKIKKLLLLDIDDTIVKASNIYIYKNLGKGRVELPLTPDEFAKENKEDIKKYSYDFRDFNNADTVSNSITSGKPIIPVLQYMDRMIGKGYKIGILTARGMESVIRETIQGWLMYMKHSKLRNIGNKLKEVAAVNDDIKYYDGANSYEKKANVIKDLHKKYDKILFLDDDNKNVIAVNNLMIKGIIAKNILEVTND